MIITLLGIVAFCIGAIGRRVAGGAFEQWTGLDIGDLPVRVFFAVTVASAALMGGATWLIAGLMVPAVWVGTTTGNFESLAMGVDHKYGVAHDWLGMTAHGMLSAVLPAAVVLWATDSTPVYWAVFVAITFLASPCYYLGWRLTGNGFGVPRIPVGFKGGTEVAECLWGGVTALSVFLAFAI